MSMQGENKKAKNQFVFLKLCQQMLIWIENMQACFYFEKYNALIGIFLLDFAKKYFFATGNEFVKKILN